MIGLLRDGPWPCVSSDLVRVKWVPAVFTAVHSSKEIDAKSDA